MLKKKRCVIKLQDLFVAQQKYSQLILNNDYFRSQKILMEKEIENNKNNVIRNKL